MSDKQPKSIYLPLSKGLISYEKLEEEYPEDPLANVHKNQTMIQMGEAFEDDVFKLSKQGLPKGVVIKRLKDIYEVGSSIKQAKYIRQNYRSEHLKSNQTTSHPSYISQLKMFPEWHFLYLIEPETINEKGFYHVAVVKEGRIIKKIVDDYVYYDQQTKRIYSHPFLEDKPWIHIIIKTWAKMNRGFQNISNPIPFQFVKAFTFPDWGVFNPSLQNLENIIKRFSSNNKKDFIFIGKTKESSNVGLFGLIPNCASYLITGYYQEYENIFISVKSFVGDKWNNRFCDKQVKLINGHQKLDQGQFMLPIKDFINLFHLVYFTSNKFSLKNPTHYNKLTLNLDARESKAKLIRLEVQGNDKATPQNVNLNLYFPTVKTYDLANGRENYKKEMAIPFCKILLGKEMENQNNLQSSYADSVKEKLLKNQGQHFLALSNHKYEFIRGDYFLGYSNDITYHLKLKPGSYILRLKIEKLLPQYRTIINVTSTCPVKLSENKSFSTEDQSFFLAETLSSKARSQQQKNSIFPNQKIKHTWLKLNNDFNQLGYGSILFQIGKNDNRRLNIDINSQKIKQSGYRLKNKAALIDSKYKITLRQKQSKILILKQDVQWKGKQRKWPPQGIHLKFDTLNQKLETVQQQ